MSIFSKTFVKFLIAFDAIEFLYGDVASKFKIITIRNVIPIILTHDVTFKIFFYMYISYVSTSKLAILFGYHDPPENDDSCNMNKEETTATDARE